MVHQMPLPKHFMTSPTHSTHSKLTHRYAQLFQNPRPVDPLSLSVSESTKVVVFSDCHLDREFNQRQFDQFVQVISNADQVVMNGDFWIDSGISFDDFMKTDWVKLFPYLKEKNTQYVFGNHDMPAHSDQRIFQFCTAAGFALKLQAGDLRLHIEHGHLLSKGLVKIVLRVFENHPKALFFATWLVGIFAEWAMANEKRATKQGKSRHNSLLKKLNSSFKKERYSVSSSEEYFVMGHTHVQEFDEAEKYINLGRTHQGDFGYLTIWKNHFQLVADS